MVALSVLDLSPIVEGGDAAQSLRNTRDLAQHAERLGYRRYWLAEHHNMPGVASAATAVVIGHVAQATSTIRVGAGGIMLPNHAPLVVAEQFGTLAALHPGRIDLGLGRAPGSDQVTARALRRTLAGDIDDFPRDVVELMAYFEPVKPGQLIQAVPGAGQEVEVWMLGSSTYGAQLAAALGLPYAFASHFAPAMLLQAIEVYRRGFKPSAQCEKPYVMIGVPLVAAPSDAEATYLASSIFQRVLGILRGARGLLQPPQEGFFERLSAQEKAGIADFLACAVIGSPDTVRQGLQALAAETGCDEMIFTCDLYDPALRLRSLDIAAQVRQGGVTASTTGA